MERREEVLQEALKFNHEQTLHWNNIKAQNETAIYNMDRFSQDLTVNVMVPVGKKALMYGQLIHTNEVFVGHSENFCSKCSVYDAKNICINRINNANEFIKNLEKERDLWINKLNIPYNEGVMPNENETEIIEDYDEEKEKIWREKHKAKVKEHKINEKQSKSLKEENFKNDDADIFNKLEERELMEELEQELERLEEQEVTDNTLQRLMSGEIKVNSKVRKSHVNKEKVNKEEEKVAKKFQENTDSIPNIAETVKENSINSEIENVEIDEYKEVQMVKNQNNFLPLEDQITNIKLQIKFIEQKLKLLPMRNVGDVEEKTRLFMVLDALQDLLEITEANEVSDSEEIPDEIALNKRKISFASEDQTIEFKKNEAVSLMLPQNKNIKRDIITLNDTSIGKDDKKKLLLDTVEKNVQFVSEKQSVEDCNLIDKIIGDQENVHSPLRITVKHSKQPAYEGETDISNPIAPSDFFEYYKHLKKSEAKIVYTNSYPGEEHVKVPVLRECERAKSFERATTDFSTFINKDDRENIPVEPKTGILKSKAMHTSGKQVLKEVLDKSYAVPSINDENAIPDSLPVEKFVDVHAPKRRVSHFRQMREAFKTKT